MRWKRGLLLAGGSALCLVLMQTATAQALGGVSPIIAPQGARVRAHLHGAKAEWLMGQVSQTLGPECAIITPETDSLPHFYLVSVDSLEVSLKRPAAGPEVWRAADLGELRNRYPGCSYNIGEARH